MVKIPKQPDVGTVEFITPDDYTFTLPNDTTHWAKYQESLDVTITIRRSLPYEKVEYWHTKKVAKLYTNPMSNVVVSYSERISTTAEAAYKYGRFQPGTEFTTPLLTDSLGTQPSCF